MSNYTKTVNFAAKDALTTGDANKVVKGTEIDTEFNNIATAVATKIDSSGALGTPTSVTLTYATGLPLTTGVTGILPVANGGTGSTLILPVANGGTGSASGVAASIVTAGTFSTGDYAFASTSRLQLGPISPSASHRLTTTSVTGHPSATMNLGSSDSSTGIVVTDQVVGSSSRILIAFSTGTFPGTAYANVSTNGTTVTYGTGSDYRLKTNVTPLTDSTAKVKALKPYSYNWVSAPTLENQGFLAHELALVVPQAVSGEKDALYPDGSMKIQQVDLSYVVPLLTAALQEALARIEVLEAA
jgi:hypothetical protein